MLIKAERKMGTVYVVKFFCLRHVRASDSSCDWLHIIPGNHVRGSRRLCTQNFYAKIDFDLRDIQISTN